MYGQVNKGLKCYSSTLFFLLLASVALPVEISILPSSRINPGSAVLIKISDIGKVSPRLIVDGKEVPVIGQKDGSFIALWGADLYKRGDVNVRVDVSGEVFKRKISIMDYTFPVERLTLPPEKVFLSAADLARAEEEKRTLDALWVLVTPERLWSGNFIMPADGKEGSEFGVRRIINGEERSPHTGRDIVAEEGAIVRATNRGRVVFTGRLFFGGNSVLIDHGLGIYSMYFHLSRVDVDKGKIVEKGQQIGLVGSSGRASGPHLHWGFRLQNARIDPKALLSLNLNETIKD